MRAKIHSILTIIALMCLGVALSVAADITSNGTCAGGKLWSDASAWVGGAVPAAGDNVTIASGDSISVDAAITPGDLIIQSGAMLVGTNMITSATSGTLTIASNGWFYENRSSGTKWPQLFGTYNIDPNSNYVVTSSGPSSILNAPPYIFGNLIINRSGAVLIATTALTSVEIQGNLIVNAGAGGSFKLSNNKSSAGSLNTVHIAGNIYVVSGTLSAIDNINAQTIVDVDGDVIVGVASISGAATLATISSSFATPNRVGIFNIGGNLSFVNGGTLKSSTGTGTVDDVGIINLQGNFLTDETALTGNNTAGMSFAINFVGTGTQYVTLGTSFKFTPSQNFTMNDTIAATSNVVFNGGYSWYSTATGAPNGDGQWIVNGSLTLGATDTLKGTQGFTLNSGATLITANANGLDSLTGSIQVSGVKTLSVSANYEYNGTVAQVTGTLLPATVNNLTIDNESVVTLSQATTVNGVLLLSAGLLDNSVNPIIIGPSGSIVYDGGDLDTPVPVEMTTFTAIAEGMNAKLQWRTATETNNYGFEIERRAISSNAWSTVGFVPGAGTSASPHEYSYSDNNLAVGEYVYRIKQIDNGGDFKYSLNTQVKIQGALKAFTLSQNYPNPFNPSTMIRFTVPENGNVRLRIYNLIGQEVASLYNGPAEAGNRYDVNFDASQLSSGLYFSVLEFGNQRLISKMMLTK